MWMFHKIMFVYDASFGFGVAISGDVFLWGLRFKMSQVFLQLMKLHNLFRFPGSSE